MLAGLESCYAATVPDVRLVARSVLPKGAAENGCRANDRRTAAGREDAQQGDAGGGDAGGAGERILLHPP